MDEMAAKLFALKLSEKRTVLYPDVVVVLSECHFDRCGQGIERDGWHELFNWAPSDVECLLQLGLGYGAQGDLPVPRILGLRARTQFHQCGSGGIEWFLRKGAGRLESTPSRFVSRKATRSNASETRRLGCCRCSRADSSVLSAGPRGTFPRGAPIGGIASWAIAKQGDFFLVRTARSFHRLCRRLLNFKTGSSLMTAHSNARTMTASATPTSPMSWPRSFARSERRPTSRCLRLGALERPAFPIC